jgi:hypothetical protein
VTHDALGAGEHRVVVREHHGARRRFVEQLTVHGPDAAHDAVRGADTHQVVDGTAVALSRERERPVLDEAAVVDEVGDVFARRALAGLAPLRDGFRAAFVARLAQALAKLRELGTNGLCRAFAVAIIHGGAH